jgi:hypothetical protein
MQAAMLRMEDRIRKLCAELLAKRYEEDVSPIVVELQDALHGHIEHMRRRFGSYPFLVERRGRKDIPPATKRHEDDVAKKASMRKTGT